MSATTDRLTEPRGYQSFQHAPTLDEEHGSGSAVSDRAPLLAHRESSPSSSAVAPSVTLSRTHFRLLLAYALVVTISLLLLLVDTHTSLGRIAAARVADRPTCDGCQPARGTSLHDHTDDVTARTRHGSGLGDASSDDNGPTFDNIFPKHLPWGSSPPPPPPSPSEEPTHVPSPATGTCPTGDLGQEWVGPVSYTARPYLPSHHYRAHLARFLHLTDLHLEPSYAPTHFSTAPTRPGVCRRDAHGDGSDGATLGDLDWTAEGAGRLRTHGFPLGRSNCDTPLALLESALDTLVSFAGPAHHANKTEEARLAADENARAAAALALGGLDVPGWGRESDEEAAKDPFLPIRLPSSAPPPALATPLPPYEFISLTGDLVAHFVGRVSTHEETLRHVLRRLVGRLADRVRGGAASFLPAIGNTDLYPTNYIEKTTKRVPFATAGVPHQTVAECHPTFRRLLAIYTAEGLLADTQAQRDFCVGGYFSHAVTRLRLRVVTLNTVPYSPNYLFDPSIARELADFSDVSDRPHAKTKTNANSDRTPLDVVDRYLPTQCDSSDRDEDPFGQLSWLRRVLSDAAASGERVILAGHIPPGHKDAPHEFAWCARYVNSLVHVLREYDRAGGRPVLTSLFGDFSEDVVRFLYPHQQTRNASRDEHVEFDPYNAARLHLSSPRDADSLTAASLPPTPSLSIFVAPGLSPRKNINPSVRVWYLERDDDAEADATGAKTVTGVEKAPQEKSDSHSRRAANVTAAAAAAAANGTHTEHDQPSHQKSPEAAQSLASWLPWHGDLPADAPEKNATSAAPSESFSVRLADYSQWYLPLQYANGASVASQSWSWQYHYSFRSSYQLADLSPSTLSGFSRAIATNPLLARQYELHAGVNQPSGPTYTHRVCDMMHIEASANELCRRTGDLG